MFHAFKVLLVSCCILMLASCSSVRDMPLKASLDREDVLEKSILFGRVIILNENKPRHQPKLEELVIRRGKKKISFIKPLLLQEPGGVGEQYLFSITLEPGDATLDLLRFTRRSLFLHGSADLPIQQRISFPKRGIVYIGNIYVNIRPRLKGQPRAGNYNPLFDQYISGFINGTFSVDIRDFFAVDTELLLEQFPFLSDKRISKRILKEWTYPEASQPK